MSTVLTDAAPGAPRPARTGRPGGRTRRPRPWSVYLATGTALFFLVAVAAPGVLDTTDPLALNLSQALQAPGPGHWFGTDEAGRDLWSRVVHGARPSLAIGAGASAVSLSLAVVLGSLAALGGRVVGPAVDRLVEVLFSFPSLLLALLLVALLGPSALTQAVAVGVGTAPGYARMVRGQVLSARGSAYVEAAVALGHSPARILRRHVLPNALRPLVAIMALSIGQSIVWASSLSFLGLGVAPPSSEWGALLEAGRPYVAHAWWLTVVPGLVIVALALAATTLGNHLQSLLERRES
ncbi:ABC transporter permease [Kineococcus terrestris]|uniref:ABC transporter permease n=1 Tax=Kineococcus terrestris TaxID=2044856 RepID=UPI00359F4677